MSTEVGYRRSEELRARGRRIWWTALLISMVFHLLLFLYFGGQRGMPASPFAAAGPRSGDDQAAAAGGGMQAINLREAPPEQAEPTPAPVPAEAVVVIVPDPIPLPDLIPDPQLELKPPTLPELPGTGLLPGTGGAARGEGVESGVEGGTGKGDGGADREGRFRVVPPSPRGLILPPGDRPGKVRGKEVTVWVFVTTAGAVVADSTRLVPSTGDSKFDERLRKQAAEWVFQPARRDGEVIAEWFRYTITL